MSKFISVIIPTYNRDKILIKVLPSYLKQKYIKEILVVDDLSNDNTEQMVKEFARINRKVKYIKNNRREGAIETTNTGILHATGEYIFIGEDDIELSDNHLEILFKHLQKENADVISGRRIWVRLGESHEEAIRRADKNKEPLIDYRSLLTNFQGFSKDDIQIPLLDACMLLKRSVTNRVRFDSDLLKDVVAWRGESDFQLAAAAQGFKLIFCPHTYCIHRARRPKNLTQTIKYNFFAFKNNYFFLKKHKGFIVENLEFKNVFLIYFFGIFVILKGNLLIFGGKVKRILKNIFIRKSSHN